MIIPTTCWKNNRQHFHIDCFFNKFNRRMLDTIMEKYKMSLESKGEIPAKYTYIYSVSGVIGIMGEWIDSDFSISSKKLAKMVLQMCVKATKNG